MQHLNGLSDLLPFLNFLSKRKIWYIIEHCRDDAIMVSFTLVGVRVEVDFFCGSYRVQLFQRQRGRGERSLRPPRPDRSALGVGGRAPES